MKIGLLGGSFNPAHAGHLHLSLEALKRLRLDEVWWLVSPQNPLKSSEEIADYGLRVQKAREVARRHSCIKICEIEAEQGLRYTVETLRFLLGSTKQRAYPSKCETAKPWGVGRVVPHKNQYIWLMGADNLAQFHRWKGWREIFALAPIAVFDRAPYTREALRSEAAVQFAGSRRSPSKLNRKTPCWCFCRMPLHPESATALRKTLGKAAFLGHNEGG